MNITDPDKEEARAQIQKLDAFFLFLYRRRLKDEGRGEPGRGHL